MYIVVKVLLDKKINTKGCVGFFKVLKIFGAERYQEIKKYHYEIV